MDVYIVESGSYEDTHISGVYSSLEKAMAAHPADWKQSDNWWHTTVLIWTKQCQFQGMKLTRRGTSNG